MLFMSEENNNIEVKIVNSDHDFNSMKKVRAAVFSEEMNIPLEEEFDGNDYSASHVLALSRQNIEMPEKKAEGIERFILENKRIIPIGTMRIRYFSDFVKFERMAVLRDYRKSNASGLIMQKGFDFVSRKGYRHVYGMCKIELLNRWKRCGYQEVLGAPHMVQNGMELIPIMRELEANPQAVKINDHPSVLVATEDFWENARIKVNEMANIESLESQKRAEIAKDSTLIIKIQKDIQKLK